MPFDTTNWKAMIIRGKYPDARFFNFDTYIATGSVTDSIIDSDITPANGSTNPFATPEANNGSQNYTIAVGANTIGSPNFRDSGSKKMKFPVGPE